MSVPSNMLAPILVSGIVWLLVAFMLVFPLIITPSGGGATQAITIGLMLLLTMINIIMFLV